MLKSNSKHVPADGIVRARGVNVCLTGEKTWKIAMGTEKVFKKDENSSF